ncbi:hypothetical protein ACNKHK_26570 [Shigella flexneri]
MLKNPNVKTVEHVIVLTYRWKNGMAGRSRPVVARSDPEGQLRNHQPEEDERRKSAVYPVYLRLNWQAEGVLHTTGGYLVYAATTFKYVFDYHQGDIYW